MLAALMAMLAPQGAWADYLETAVVGDKTYYVLRSNEDWLKFRQLVKESEGTKDIDAIIDADITVKQGQGIGQDGWPYRGTFNGNGHVIDARLDSQYDFEAPFIVVTGETTIRDASDELCKRKKSCRRSCRQNDRYVYAEPRKNKGISQNHNNFGPSRRYCGTWEHGQYQYI